MMNTEWMLTALFSLFSTSVFASELVPLRVPATTGMEFSDDKPWAGQAELSLLSTKGNTDTLSLGVKTSAKRNWQYWALVARGEYLQNRDGVVVTAKSYLFGLRGIRKFAGFDIFSDNEYQRNEFAGFMNMYKFAFGVGKEFFKTGSQHLRLELAPAFVTEERVSKEVINFGSLSAQALHKWKLTDTVELNSRLSYLANLNQIEDTRYELELGLVAPVSNLFSLKAGYLAQYRRVPPPGTKKVDGKTTVSLLATF